MGASPPQGPRDTPQLDPAKPALQEHTPAVLLQVPAPEQPASEEHLLMPQSCEDCGCVPIAVVHACTYRTCSHDHHEPRS